MTGVTAYPDPSRGYLDQDAETMLAFEILDDAYQAQQEAEERRAEVKKKAADLFHGQ